MTTLEAHDGDRSDVVAWVVVVTGSWKPPSKTRTLAEAFIAELTERHPIAVTRIDLAEVGQLRSPSRPAMAPSSSTNRCL